MRIVRAPIHEGWSAIPNEALEDTRLSFKARGLLAYLLSRPPGWLTSASRLAGGGPDGRERILTGLRELEAAGYLRRYRQQDERGHWSTYSEVRDRPTGDGFSVSGDATGDGFSGSGKPGAGKPVSINNTDEQEPHTPNSVADALARSVPRIHVGQHKRCRQCGTAPRSAPPRPEWCGECDASTRLRDLGTGSAVYRCPNCHPLAATP